MSGASNLGDQKAIHSQDPKADLEAAKEWSSKYAHRLKTRDPTDHNAGKSLHNKRGAEVKNVPSKGTTSSQPNPGDRKQEGKSKESSAEPGWLRYSLTETGQMHYSLIIYSLLWSISSKNVRVLTRSYRSSQSQIPILRRHWPIQMDKDSYSILSQNTFEVRVIQNTHKSTGTRLSNPVGHGSVQEKLYLQHHNPCSFAKDRMTGRITRDATWII